MKSFGNDFPKVTETDMRGNIIVQGDVFLPFVDEDQILTHKNKDGETCEGNVFDLICASQAGSNYFARCLRCETRILMAARRNKLEMNPGTALVHGLNATKLEGWEPALIDNQKNGSF